MVKVWVEVVQEVRIAFGGLDAHEGTAIYDSSATRAHQRFEKALRAYQVLTHQSQAESTSFGTTE